ncbi:AAA family ATPase [Paenibacillus sp. BC26]|uniref:AAA family ATPase n=1 Tax=Paenibacillus sp. BC26 TaxID=1881032 RepID=UPI0008E7F286|nr:AAA family ATPase [Paenibacillus sp. BC26]SFT19154.1 AAA ATPase domain-containing protein [Paenibacillus sp. BC26]
MKLAYLWIESYGVFKETGFHFSNNYKFDYKLGTLTVSNTLEQVIPNDFFGANCIDVSVVVGDNGAGKTSLLKCILDCMACGVDDIDLSFIAVFYDQPPTELHIYTHRMPVIQVTKDEGSSATVIRLDESAFIKEVNKTKLVYISNALDLNDYSLKKRGTVFDGSTGGLLRRDYFSNQESRHITSEENPVYNFFNNEVYRQIDFLTQNKFYDSERDMPFKMPEFLEISVVKNDRNLKNTHEILSIESHAKYGSENQTIEIMNENEKIRELLYMVHDSLWRLADNKEMWFSQIAEHLVINAIKEVAEPNTTADKRTTELTCLLEVFEPFKEGTETILSYCRNFLIRASEKIKEKKSINAYRLIPYQVFIEWLIQNYSFFDIEVNSAEPSLAVARLKKGNLNTFKDFFEHYNKTCRPYFYLNFSWGLSTGESNLLSLYARLYSVLKPDLNGGRSKQIVNHIPSGEVQCSNVLLLIDEADLSYHPRWQIKYLDALLGILTTVYANYDVQVILTTHSPILLSDVPRSQVLYLKDGKVHHTEEHQETFGQNIYTLFNDAFFLDTTVGEFSDRMIKEVSGGLDELLKVAIDLNNSSYDNNDRNRKNNENNYIPTLERYEYIIGIIGEPVIRRAFESKFQQIRSAYLSKELKESITRYNDLSPEDRDRLIDYIIKTSDERQ